jgi:hypothetical protein
MLNLPDDVLIITAGFINKSFVCFCAVKETMNRNFGFSDNLEFLPSCSCK